MFSYSNIAAQSQASPWPRKKGGMVSQGIVPSNRPNFGGHQSVTNPLFGSMQEEGMGLHYNVRAPSFGQFPPASVQNEDVVDTGPLPVPTIFLRPDFSQFLSNSSVEEASYEEGLFAVSFVDYTSARIKENINSLDLVHQHAAVCTLFNTKNVCDKINASNLGCCLLGVIKQTKPLPTVNYKRDFTGMCKENKFGVSIQHSGLTRCQNLFLKTNEEKLIQPGCPIHIVCGSDGILYAVVNNGHGKPTENKVVTDVLKTVTDKHFYELERMFVGFVVHGEKTKRRHKTNTEVVKEYSRRCDKECGSTCTQAYTDTITIFLCCDEDNMLRKC